MVQDRSSGHNMEAVFSKQCGKLHGLMAYWCIQRSTADTEDTSLFTALDSFDL